VRHDEELRWVRRREGAHRSSSRATPGYERDLLREDNTEDLLGPTESRPADIDEIVRSRSPQGPSLPTPGQQFRSRLGDAIMEALTPYIEWGVDVAVDSAVLGLTKLWRWATSRPSQRKTAERLNETETVEREVETLQGATVLGSDTPEAIGLTAPIMTAEQYQAILLSALLADQYAARARQMLANVRIQDEALPAELEHAIRAALDGPSPIADDLTLARAVELLRASKTPDGEFVLVQSHCLEGSRSLSDRGGE